MCKDNTTVGAVAVLKFHPKHTQKTTKSQTKRNTL